MRLTLPLTIDTWARIRDLRRACAPRGKPVAVACPEAGPGLWHVVAVGEARTDLGGRAFVDVYLMPASDVRPVVPARATAETKKPATA